jgi:hypothetical protein
MQKLGSMDVNSFAVKTFAKLTYHKMSIHRKDIANARWDNWTRRQHGHVKVPIFQACMLMRRDSHH